jgi:predicted DsbA family dithiol-disulfide isomerase
VDEKVKDELHFCVDDLESNMTSAQAAEQAPRADAARLRLDVWTDLGCPWCYVGIHRLRRAMDDLGVADRVELVLRSFELDPGASAEPMTISEIFTRKHGLTARDAAQAEARVQKLAHAEGLPFTTERLHANSFDVHRVLQLANRHGRGVDFFEAVQQRYFAGQINPYQHDSLIAVAVETGLDGEMVRDVLAGNGFADQVREDEAAGRRLGVTGVPFVVLDQQYAIAGAQSAAAYAQAIAQVLETRQWP